MPTIIKNANFVRYISHILLFSNWLYYLLS